MQIPKQSEGVRYRQYTYSPAINSKGILPSQRLHSMLTTSDDLTSVVSPIVLKEDTSLTTSIDESTSAAKAIFCVGSHSACKKALAQRCNTEIHCWTSLSGKKVCGCYRVNIIPPIQNLAYFSSL